MSDAELPQEPSVDEAGPGSDGNGNWGRLLRRNGGTLWSEPKPEPKAKATSKAVAAVAAVAVGGHSPLTDPRALGSSLAFHVVLLIVASVAALSVRMPTEADTTAPALRGEIGPVDNRAQPDTGGGSPGDLGGRDTVRLAADGRSAEAQALRDPEADALLSEILPATASPDSSQRALPGPMTTGLGALPGLGSGGGGGSGGGSGGGVGRGVGPGTEFFGAREQAGSFTYVIDCSGSMSVYRALDVAKRELMASLTQLPPDAQFAVVFYNLRARVFADAGGNQGLMPATKDNKARVQTLLSTVDPDGGTDHMTALRTALALHAEVVFFLTDADQMDQKDVKDILAIAGKTRIQAIEFGEGAKAANANPLHKLATSTGGTYRYIDVFGFRQPRIR